MNKTMLKLIVLFITTFLIGSVWVFDLGNDKNKSDEAQQVEESRERNGEFKKRFVVIEEFEYGEKIVLDLEEGCKYVVDGKRMSPLGKDGKFDCNKEYIVEYKNKNNLLN